MAPCYDFRYKTVLHEKGCCTARRRAGTDEIKIDSRFEIVLPKGASRLSVYAARDLCAFFADCAGVYLRVRYSTDMERERRRGGRKILLFDAPAAALPVDSAQKGAFFLRIEEKSVLIVGRTDRGLAQGVYHIEDCMKLCSAPILQKGEALHAPLFSPRMTHSGFELDTFSDLFLQLAAHAGMDAILVYAGHADSNLHGFSDPDPLWPDSKMGLCDFADLCERAEEYGMDVYIYSHLKCDMHPDAPGAREYYDASFGALMRSAPKIKGFILVGETFEFPSKDPHTCGVRFQKKAPGEPLPSPGWYPCFDYPQLLFLVGSVVHEVNPEAELVFWSYNWGWAPKEARQAIIRALPRGTTLLVTFDMWEEFTDALGRRARIDDYSISITGPSSIFCDEAEEAKRCGVKLYAMTNTGGRTWDCGIAPYLPVPGQWIGRYEGMRRCAEQYGLCGVMENHHYGWTPSFLTLLAKNAFDSAGIKDREMLRRIAAHEFGAAAPTALAAYECFDRGIRSIVAAEVDQYGPLRAGPAYPFLFDQTASQIHYPAPRYAWHPGGGIWFFPYPDTVLDDPKGSLFRLERMRAVRAEFERGQAHLEEAARTLRGAKRQAALQQAAVSGALLCTFATAQNIMCFNIALRLWRAAEAAPQQPEFAPLYEALGFSAPAGDAALAAYMKEIAHAESRNVKRALRYAQANSLVGYEPSMEYVFCESTAAYKEALTKQSLRRLAAAQRRREAARRAKNK